MSQQNVDFVRGLFDGAGALDKQAIMMLLPELVPQVFTDDAEWIEDPARADQKIWRGHDGIMGSWRAWLDQWDDYSFVVGEIEDHGDQVLVVGHEEARGAASGASVAATNHVVLTFRDGKIARYEEFYDESAARAALSHQ